MSFLFIFYDVYNIYGICPLEQVPSLSMEEYIKAHMVRQTLFIMIKTSLLSQLKMST